MKLSADAVKAFVPVEPPVHRCAGAIAEIRAGRMVVVVDDEDRENEGDLTLAADHVTPEAINFMATLRPRPHLPYPH